jgi:hypothetical protein
MVMTSAGCGASVRATSACTQIGCTSAAYLELGGLAADAPGARAVVLCVNAECRQRELTGGRYLVAGDRVVRAAPEAYAVRVTLLDSSGKALFTARRRVRFEAMYLNGRDCPVACYVRRLRLEIATKTITPV